MPKSEPERCKTCGRDPQRIRNATPPQFRDVLIGIARSSHRHMEVPGVFA